MDNESNRYYQFGEFCVDARRRILSKDGVAIPLTPRNFDLLLTLIEHEGRMVSHDDLLDKVWAGTFVEPANLKNAVSVLRKILGESPAEGAYIRTIPRRGYSFVASVHVISENGGFELKRQVPTSLLSDSKPENSPDGDIDLSDSSDDKKTGNSRLRADGTERPLSYRVTFAALLGVISIGVFFGLRFFIGAQRPIIFDATSVIISKITSDGNLVGGDASISPNGKYLVYVVREGENVSLWTRQIVTGISRQISPAAKGSVWACSLTPDEDFIYYVFNSNTDKSKSGLFKISTFGGSAQRIADNTGGSLSISPDGKRLAVIHVISEQETRIETMNLDGGDLRNAWTGQGDLRVWNVKYSPDGLTLLFSVRKQLPNRIAYYIGEVPVDGGEERIILPDQEKQIADAIWLPDKQSLLLSVRELNAELRQIWQYFPESTQWKRVTNDNASYRGISLTKDGKTLVASQESRLSSLWMSPTGAAGDLKQVISGTHYLIDVGWVSDSDVAYSIVENSKEMIGATKADGSGNRLLTSGEDGIWLFPAPSGDNRHIAFSSIRSGRRQLWQIDSDGRNPVQLTQVESDVYDGRLLSDGRSTIFLQLVTPQKPTLFLHKDDGQSRELVKAPVRHWAISPNEKLLAVEMMDPQAINWTISIVSTESGEVIRKFDVASNRVLRWTSDGKAIAYDVTDRGSGNIIIQPVEGGTPRSFLSLKSEEIFSFDWSRVGGKFAVIRGNHLTDAVKISVGSGN